MSVRLFLKQCLWIVPFLCFLGGYYLSSFYNGQTSTIKTPDLVGKGILDAVSILSAHNLSLRITGHVIDNELPEGTVTHQMPPSGQIIKTNQIILCSVTKHSEHAKAPSVIGQTMLSLESHLTHAKLRYKICNLFSQSTPGYCIAQYPTAQQSLKEKNLVLFIAKKEAPIMLFPHLKNHSVTDVKERFGPYNIKLLITHNSFVYENHFCDCIVIDQKPLPGSFIDLSKQSPIQLLVEKRKQN